MRLGVLDVGSNTVHLLVVDAHRGGHPTPAASVKNELRLSELLEPDGSLSRRGADRLIGVIAFARGAADRHGVEDLVAFATSAVREASNSGEVLGRVRDEAGVDLEVLTGDDEARLTFLAVRRWFGWSAGRLLVLDIGGGSLEVASGVDEDPDYVQSLPLGAGRLHRDWLAASDPPRRSELAALRAHVRTTLADLPAELGEADRAVATSKTFRSLARIAGAAPYSQGPRVERRLIHGQLAGMLPRLAHSTATERARLPGVSAGRAAQLLAGAVVADSVMEGIGLTTLVLCPWALREGVILRRLDWLAGV
jgi:exopolyphosphatase/guanosine-5'-triphosphate,3'-diphosphate pyrophosphatase